MEASALRAPAALGARRPGGVLLRLRSDEQLVAFFRRGDEDAFRVIHDRYRQRLSAYARQMLGGSATDADDAMQDVFLRAYAALRADDRPITLRAWLYRVAHNRCIDHIRRPASQPMVALSEETRPLPATTGDPILAAERRDDLRRLVIDVRALPEQQRSALLMREMEGLTYQELAGALEVTVPAVKSLLVRARMGLVESQQARDTPCHEIREDISAAHDRGVRMSGRARRHARECKTCAGYRSTLKAITQDLGALNPGAGPWASLAKLIGLGAGGSSAAGGAAAAGGAGAGATATGTIAAGAAASKLAAVVCCAVVVVGGGEVAREQASHPRTPAAAHKGQPAKTAQVAAAASTARPASAPSAFVVRTTAAAKRDRVAADAAAKLRAGVAAAARRGSAADPVTAMTPSVLLETQLRDGRTAVDDDGGVSAPLEAPATTGTEAGTTEGTAPAPSLLGVGTGTAGSGSTGPGTGGGSSAGGTNTGSPAASGSGASGSGATGPAAGGSGASGGSTSGPATPGSGSGGGPATSAPGSASTSSGPAAGGASAPVAP